MLNADGAVVGRFSWSNVVFVKHQTISINDETGALIVNDVFQGYLKAAFSPDKNRLDGCVGVFVPERPAGPVKYVEMETLPLASI